MSCRVSPLYSAIVHNALNEVCLEITQGAVPAFVMLITVGQIALLQTLTFHLGDLLLIAACFCYALYLLCLDKWLKMPPIVMVTYFSVSALVTLTAFIIGEYATG